MRRADDLNVTAGAAHSLAARPSTLTGSLSLVTLPGFDRDARGLSPVALPVGLERLESGYRESDPGFTTAR
jgi:hypothetical protein